MEKEDSALLVVRIFVEAVGAMQQRRGDMERQDRERQPTRAKE